ncbi:LVIVD repeat-containing protein [Kineococcus gypseus]|uniref:LVIVD repeat-containing protein n=1 Tax=Kineococcus gypseus TaxID=1637102 RepID=UPI003D7D45A8
MTPVHPAPRSTPRPTARPTTRAPRRLAAAGLSLGLLAVGVPAAAAAELPGVDEVVSSANLRQIANVPKQGPFATQTAFGTDMAFQGDLAYVGNYEGFTVYDIAEPEQPRIVSQVVCPGSQNDISVYGDLLFLSTDSSRSDSSCSSVPQAATVESSWEGVKVFDVSDPASPRYVSAVETKCGSHTHTLLPDEDSRTAYLYVSSYSPAPTLPDCAPPHDLISIVEVPLDAPEQASLAAEPVLFPDGGFAGGPHPDGTSTRRATEGCHDITVYPAKDLAAGACMGDGVIMDISDPLAPRVIDRVQDPNFAFWHSATFNDAGTKVVFTDELGGGGAATCLPTVSDEFGADAIYDITGAGDDRALERRSYFKIPRDNGTTENCVAHNGSLVPVQGKDIMVQAWYQGGISVWDFTDSSEPEEIAFWERGPLSQTELVLGGSWSAYYYNGHVYSSDIQKGLDVLTLKDPATASARSVHLDRLNVQTQPETGERGGGHGWGRDGDRGHGGHGGRGDGGRGWPRG